MKFFKYITLFIIFIHISCSANSNSDSLIIKDWKILYEQDILRETVLHKSGWEPIDIPFTIKLPYSYVQDYQFVWLKGKFIFNEKSDENLCLSLGKVNGFDKVYINKYVIGSKSIKKQVDRFLSSNYIIPTGVLKNGKNDIYVRLGIYGNNYVGIKSEVVIQSQEVFKENQVLENFFTKQLPIGMIILFIIILLLYLVYYLFERNWEMHIYNIIFALISYISILSIFFSDNNTLTTNLIYTIQSALFPLIAVLLIFFIQYIYNIYIEHNRIIIPILFITALIIIFSKDIQIFNYYLAFILQVIIMLTGIPYIVYLISTLNSAKPDQQKLYAASILLSIVSIQAIWQIISVITKVYYPDILNLYILSFYGMILIIYNIRESMIKRIQLDHLYEKLRKPGKDEVSIPHITEETVKNIIHFIGEHYTSHISAHRLAESVGVNTHYFTSLFNAHTGKKINEYVNELRIQDAAKKIREGNRTIPHAAISVGYHSLSTFNRVFKSIIGKSPRKYKSEL